MEIIKVENINKFIANEHILKNIELSVKQGEFVSIIGPSGSGKSTLLYILGLLDQPTDGKVFVENQEINFEDKKRISEIRNKKFGFVFQFHYLINELTALENVMVPMLKSGVEKSVAVDIAIKNLEKLGLEKKQDRRPYELSGGEQQKVSIARALSNNPLVIIADEPTGNLDSKNTEIVMEIFENLNKEGRTIIMVTHEIDLAERTQRIIKLKDGEIIEDVKKI